MAKEDYDAGTLIEIEGDLHEIAGKLREIRMFMKEADESSVSLDLGTVLFYVSWLKRWASKNKGVVEAAMSARKKRKEVKSQRAKS